MKLAGVDVGGTFTDVIVADTETAEVWIHKVPSTAADPSEGLIAGVSGADGDPAAIDALLHGTTIATNALLQHDGARVGLITTRGYRDILHIARHQRPQHYSIHQEVPVAGPRAHPAALPEGRHGADRAVAERSSSRSTRTRSPRPPRSSREGASSRSSSGSSTATATRPTRSGRARSCSPSGRTSS